MADKKARSWECIGYPESMICNWEEEIYSLFQVPFAYCVHDKDVDKMGEKRKTHVHIIIVFPNTTTYKHALEVFKQLGDISNCKACINIRWCYDYLIHDTDDSRKKKKYLYDKKDRITGNGFDIGFLEQDSLVDKKRARLELSKLIIDNNITNYADLYMYVASNFEPFYEDILCTYSGHFERLTKGLYNRMKCDINKLYAHQQKIIDDLINDNQTT